MWPTRLHTPAVFSLSVELFHRQSATSAVNFGLLKSPLLSGNRLHCVAQCGAPVCYSDNVNIWITMEHSFVFKSSTAQGDFLSACPDQTMNGNEKLRTWNSRVYWHENGNYQTMVFLSNYTIHRPLSEIVTYQTKFLIVANFNKTRLKCKTEKAQLQRFTVLCMPKRWTAFTDNVIVYKLL